MDVKIIESVDVHDKHIRRRPRISKSMDPAIRAEAMLRYHLVELINLDVILTRSDIEVLWSDAGEQDPLLGAN